MSTASYCRSTVLFAHYIVKKHSEINTNVKINNF